MVLAFHELGSRRRSRRLMPGSALGVLTKGERWAVMPYIRLGPITGIPAWSASVACSFGFSNASSRGIRRTSTRGE